MRSGWTVRGCVAGVLVLILALASFTPPAEADEAPPALAGLSVLGASCGGTTLPAPDRTRAHQLLAQAGLSPVPPAPGEAPSSAPTGTATSPGATPTPSESPTLPPLPRPPVGGPGGVLVPPVYQTSEPTPPPLPTPPPPLANPTGPVLLIQASGTPAPIIPLGSPTAVPTGTPRATGPSPIPTLGPNQYAVLADQILGGTTPGTPADAIGHVNVFYSQGVMVGDRAHYDGTRYIDVTGEHVYLRNRVGDTILYAESIRFDTLTQHAYLRNGKGETLEGVQQGALHFTAQNLQTDRFGDALGTNASITTCENPRGGYHIESKSLDLRPDDRLILRKSTVYLGALAIFYLPFLLIPLTHNEYQRRPTTFMPVFGYSQDEGAYMKSTIGFGTTPYYYGYYRLDIYTKLGIGFGYVAFFRKRNNRRSGDINFYRLKTNSSGQSNYNLTADETENYSAKLRSQLSLNYTGNYGPGITLPPSYQLTGSVVHTGARESQNYSFSRYTSGSSQSSVNIGLTDQRQITNHLSNGINVTYTDNLNSNAGTTTSTTSLTFNTDTHYASPGVDYDMVFNRTESATPYGIEKLPEITVKPHVLFPNDRIVPVSAQLVMGEYSEPQSALATQRVQGAVNVGPALFRVFNTSTFSGTVNVQQDYYGTGDLKALITQNFSLTTPFGPHVVNAITYNESNSNGPLAEPFKTLDILGTNTKGAQDVLRIYNGTVYNLALTTGTNFNMQAQPISYQLTTRPSYRSAVVIGGSWNPGPGNGFSTSNIQIITPFGRGSDIQFSTNVDWKNKGRLEDKTLFYRRTIGDCYQILVAYNQDLKQLNFAVQLLAFPSQSVGFGLGSQTSIIPQSLTF